MPTISFLGAAIEVPGIEQRSLRCDQTSSCTSLVTHIDNSGFLYCTRHGISRRSVKPCRKLRPYELNRLKNDKPLTRY